MKYVTSPLELMTPQEMRVIHENTLDLLKHTGLCIDHDGILDALEAEGARVDRSDRVARLPGCLVEQAARATATWPCFLNDEPRAVTEAESQRIEAVLSKPLGFAFGGSGLEMIGADGRSTRPVTWDDLERTVRFGNGHPRISSVGGPPTLVTHDAEGRELPAEIRCIAGMQYMAKHSRKLGWCGIESPADVAFAAELGALLSGDVQTWRRAPFFLCCRCSVSPLRIDRSSAETLHDLARRSLPVTLAPMPLAGGSTPVTPASAILIANAEILGFIAAMWAVGTESPVSSLVISGAMDMQTTIASFSSPNAVLQDVGLAQLQSRFYGLPCSVFSDYIDAKYPGYQSGSERALKLATLAACGQICPSVGQLKSGLACSPEQACLDIEAFDWMHHFLRGIEVSADSLCLGPIRERGIGGDFLGTDHTFEHFREELFLPKLSDRTANEVRDMVEGATHEVNRILDVTPVYSRGEALCAEIDRLYELEVEKRISKGA